MGRAVTPGPVTVPGTKRDGTPVNKGMAPSPKVTFPRAGTGTTEIGKDEVAKVGSGHAKGNRDRTAPVKETGQDHQGSGDTVCAGIRSSFRCSVSSDRTSRDRPAGSSTRWSGATRNRASARCPRQANANNACLIGAPGVGRTSVVRGSPCAIANGDDVACFEDKSSWASSPPHARGRGGCVGRSPRESVSSRRSSRAPRAASTYFSNKEVRVLFGQDAGDEESTRLALARGGIVCIGATTEMDYRT